ncbi:MAG: hypothetical protein LW878_13910 [Proteobacteria bacterium]|nr:hypothetical protein [Pseudomonadota bacterium]
MKDPVNSSYDPTQVSDLADSDEEQGPSAHPDTRQAAEGSSGTKRKAGHSGRHATKTKTQSTADGNDVSLWLMTNSLFFSKRLRSICKDSGDT